MLWCLCSKKRVKGEDERAELRWKLWLGEKAIMVWTRLIEIVGTVRGET